ncbi:MAG TPA: lysylphosphatidylglycerol synthase transmembrane domain-containing protein [Candidatus Binatia bacterium]|jgi:hypothetical protein
MMKKAKPILVLLIKILVSLGLLAFFFSRIHIERFFNTFASANFAYIGLAMAVYFASQFLGAIRWKVLARPLGFNVSLKLYFVFYLIGMFFNLFAPGTVGGDVSRIYYLAREGDAGREKRWGGATMNSAVVVFIDRVIGMMVLIWVGAMGLLLFPQYRVPHAVRLLTFGLAAAFIAGGLLLPILRRLLPAGSHPILVKLRVAVSAYNSDWRAVPQAIGLSFVIHFLQAWIHLMLAAALAIDLPFSYCTIIYPLVGTFSALPVSLNGLGLREGGYLYFLGLIGINSEKGIAFGLLLFLVVAADSLIGGLVFLARKSPAPAAVAVNSEG